VFNGTKSELAILEQCYNISLPSQQKILLPRNYTNVRIAIFAGVGINKYQVS